MKNVGRIINSLNETIKGAYDNFEGLYLYGSYARNNNTQDSDIDVVALFDMTLNREQRLSLWNLIGKIEIDFGVVLDLHPMSKDELENNPIYYNQVVNKGIFYAAR